MASKYGTVSPYQFGGNNPVRFNDPMGDEYTNEDFVRWSSRPTLIGGPHDTNDPNRIYRGSDPYGTTRGRLLYAEFLENVSLRKEREDSNETSDAAKVKSGEMSLEEYAARYGVYYGSGVNGLGNGLLALGALLVPNEYLASTNSGDPQDPVREGFEGGKLYAPEELWRAFADMWYASRYFDGEYKENMGVFTDKGLLVLPNYRNGPSSSGGSLIFLNQILSEDTKTLKFKDESLDVMGIIHTHPSPWGDKGHSEEKPRWTSEWIWQDRKLGNFVLGVEGLYRAQDGRSVFFGDPFAPGQTNRVLNLFRELYKN